MLAVLGMVVEEIGDEFPDVPKVVGVPPAVANVLPEGPRRELVAVLMEELPPPVIRQAQECGPPVALSDCGVEAGLPLRILFVEGFILSRVVRGDEQRVLDHRAAEVVAVPAGLQVEV